MSPINALKVAIVESWLHPCWPSNQSGCTPPHCTVHVQRLYISCYLSVNKPVLSTSRLACFHSGDPDQVVPFALYTVLLYTHTHTSAALAPVALSPAFVSDFCFKFHSVHSIGYNFHSTFSLAIPIKKQQFSLQIQFSVGSKQRAITTLDFEHVFSLLSVFSLFVRTV